jgi:hypothetical protein
MTFRRRQTAPFSASLARRRPQVHDLPGGERMLPYVELRQTERPRESHLTASKSERPLVFFAGCAEDEAEVLPHDGEHKEPTMAFFDAADARRRAGPVLTRQTAGVDQAHRPAQPLRGPPGVDELGPPSR